jgi:hypothetical protein
LYYGCWAQDVEEFAKVNNVSENYFKADLPANFTKVVNEKPKKSTVVNGPIAIMDSAVIFSEKQSW